jgi:hypothetical protein
MHGEGGGMEDIKLGSIEKKDTKVRISVKDLLDAHQSTLGGKLDECSKGRFLEYYRKYFPIGLWGVRVQPTEYPALQAAIR